MAPRVHHLRARTLVSVAAVCASTFVGCVGEIDGGAAGPDGVVRMPRATCSDARAPIPAPLSRLAREEYERSLRALLGDDAVAAAADALAGLPADDPELEGAFRRTDQRISPQHVDSYYRVADALATRVSTDAALRSSVVGACAADALDDPCLMAFAPGFLRSALRREPTTEEVARALSIANEFEGFERIHAIVFTTLMSPDFLYRFENRGAVAGDAITLTPHELAARLSFHFWGEPPDDALLAAAADGSLATDEGYAAEVERVFADPRTDATLVGFFDEWMHLERGPFAESPRLAVLGEGIDPVGLPEEMRDEVHDLLRHHLEEGGTWGDVLTSPYSFARTERLAAIYGVEAWDGSSSPPLLPEGERSGILTRAAMLYTSDGSTNPFRRGAYVRRAILCDVVAPPPNDLPPDALTPPPVVAGQNTRDAFAAKVTGEPCASCHAFFSPVGYALEAYDGLGRFRSEEWLVSTSGEDHGLAPIDPVTVPRIEYDDERPAASAVELSERIAESPKSSECLTLQYFRFTFRRHETGADRCLVDALAARVEEGLSLREAFRAIAFEPTFRQRRLEE
ncbi:MAG: DUF1592 domain-containing protein [Myxococcota bacterium]|nr:DUF1592 domain-containing protein [Myxococcota bacterium]